MSNCSIIPVQEGGDHWASIVDEFPEAVAWADDPKDGGKYHFFAAVNSENEYLGGVVLDIGPMSEGPLAGEVEGFLEDVEVLEEYRRQGVGTALVRTALDEAWAQNAQHVRWTVQYEDRAAISFYSSLGFALCPDANADGTPLNQYLVVAQNPRRIIGS